MAEHDPRRPQAAYPAYGEDYAAWLQAQIASLRAGRFDLLDMENLLDEVESLGRSDFRGFVSAIEIVVAHMLKWDHQPAKRSQSWIASIDEHRSRIEGELVDSPSHKGRIDEALRRAYRPARAIAARQTKLPLETFPATCPYDWGQIMQRDHQLDG